MAGIPILLVYDFLDNFPYPFDFQVALSVATTIKRWFVVDAMKLANTGWLDSVIFVLGFNLEEMVVGGLSDRHESKKKND